MCLDVAHAHAFSTESHADWFSAVGRWIAHMHWNDNHGDRDSHLAVGDGTLPWREIWETAATLEVEPTVVLEMNRIENIKRSLGTLARWGMRSTAILPKVA
jgi:sugar phosphate isomerase/epimerase